MEASNGAIQTQTTRQPQRVINTAQKRLYTVKEAAAYLGRCEWGMRELIWAGTIPVIRSNGGRKIYVDIKDLDRFIEQNKSVYL